MTTGEALIKLNAILRLHHSNFLNLHWNSVGIDFDDSHKGITTDYYELCDKYIDSTAEMACITTVNPPNYIDVIRILNTVVVQNPNPEERLSGSKDSDVDAYKSLIESNDEVYKYIVIDSNKLYTREEIVKFADIMLADIVCAIEECLSSNDIDEYIGIKSDLEAMYSEVDLQLSYINRRRLL
jgi:DNA-binding ferritin-like protein